MSVNTTATIASFGGKLLKLAHQSSIIGGEMKFNLYLPPQALDKSKKVPLLIYLSGLTCTAENASEKGFFQHGASKKGIAVLYPDTSPSNLFPVKLRLSYLISPQEGSVSRAKTTPTTSALVLAFMSTQPLRRGRTTTKCTLILPMNSPKPCLPPLTKSTRVE